MKKKNYCSGEIHRFAKDRLLDPGDWCRCGERTWKEINKSDGDGVSWDDYENQEFNTREIIE